jgi:hypothetical protein
MGVIKGLFLRHNFIMLTEKQLIGKIKELKQIKPNQNWVFLTKSQILGIEEKKSFSPFWNFGFSNYRMKFAFASIVAIMLMLGGYFIVERSLPGDALYLVRRAGHKVETVLIPTQEKPAYQLKLANDRLKDLTKAPARNLTPTLSELQANISEAARDLARIDASTSDPVIIKKIVDATKELKANKQKAESLGYLIGDKESSELDNGLRKMTDDLIKDLEGRTLTNSKKEILAKMKELFGEGKFSESLEFYLTNQ